MPSASCRQTGRNTAGASWSPGSQPHAEQLAELAAHAPNQMDTPGFFDLIRTPGKFPAGIRGRLDQVEKLVQRALDGLGRADTDTADAVQVQQHVWRLLAGLSDLAAASRLRDRLVTLAAEYSPKSGWQALDHLYRYLFTG